MCPMAIAGRASSEKREKFTREEGEGEEKDG